MEELEIKITKAMERIETLGNGDGNCFFLFELENVFTLDPYDLDEDYQWGVIGAAIWIVLFILLVIIIGAGWNWNNN